MKTRSDFWKCGKCGELLVRADEPHSCYFDKEWRHQPDRPATNVEVLIAWLSADDDRRKEIEVASRPTKAGSYKNYKWEGGTLQMTGWHFGEAWFDSGHTISGLWEPIE